MRAEHLPEQAMRALVEEMQIDIADGGKEAIWIAALPRGTTREVEAKPISNRERLAGNECAEQAAGEPLEIDVPSIREQRLGAHGVRVHRANDDAARCRMRAEDVVRIIVIADETAVDLSGVDARERIPGEGRRGHAVSN